MLLKRHVLKILIVMCLIFGLASLASAQTTKPVALKNQAIVIMKGVLKQAPADKAKNLAVLKKGDKLTVISLKNNWFKVQLRSKKIGYVNKKFIVQIKPVKAVIKPAVKPAAKPAAKLPPLTRENPLQVNKTDGSVAFLAEVNGKYFFEPTRHGIVYKDGSNGEKAVLRGLATPEAYFNALSEIGAKPGENMTMENKETTHVHGDPLEVSVTWDGAVKDYTINQVITDSTGKPIDVHFGGNLQNAQQYKTGCLICLDSCPVGITSNTTYSYGAVEKRKEVEFKGNKEVLPADGTLVTIKVKLKK